MSDRLSRRQFLAGATAATAFAASTDTKPLPTRPLGKTGAKVSLLAMGCGSRLWSAYQTQEEGVAALNLALDLGVRYLDTAQNYGNGKSETWVGEVLKTRRKEVFVATKIGARDPDEALRLVERSLKNLQTDRIDLIHIHTLSTAEDLAKIEAKGGVLEALYKLRDQKVTRFIGITSHYDPTVLKTALERHDFDCTQMALNAGLQGFTSGGGGNMKPNPAIQTSFELVALPVARQKNLGILAMKVMGQEALIGDGSGKGEPQKLMQYALSLPGIAAAVVGMPKVEFIRQNIAWARAFQPMPKAEMKQFSQRLADANKLALDWKFRHHTDA